MRLMGRVGRRPSMIHGGGDGRTYSGVCSGGQAARKPVFPMQAFIHGVKWDATESKAARVRFLTRGI
jgi:hypothetical protein